MGYNIYNKSLPSVLKTPRSISLFCRLLSLSPSTPRKSDKEMLSNIVPLSLFRPASSECPTTTLLLLPLQFICRNMNVAKQSKCQLSLHILSCPSQDAWLKMPYNLYRTKRRRDDPRYTECRIQIYKIMISLRLDSSQ